MRGAVGVLRDARRCTLTDGAPIPGGLYAGTGAAFGVQAAGKLRLERVRIAGFRDYGAFADRTVRVTDVTLEDNGTGILGRRIRVAGATIVGCGTGIFSSGPMVAAAVAGSGNAVLLRSGGSYVKLLDSQLAGNGIDLSSRRRARLRGATCERSQDLGSPGATGSWGICALD